MSNEPEIDDIKLPYLRVEISKQILTFNILMCEQEALSIIIVLWIQTFLVLSCLFTADYFILQKL